MGSWGTEREAKALLSNPTTYMHILTRKLGLSHSLEVSAAAKALLRNSATSLLIDEQLSGPGY